MLFVQEAQATESDIKPINNASLDTNTITQSTTQFPEQVPPAPKQSPRLPGRRLHC